MESEQEYEIGSEQEFQTELEPELELERPFKMTPEMESDLMESILFMDHKTGQIVHIREIIENEAMFENCFVRTWGKIISHDETTKRAILMSEDGYELNVNTEVIEPYKFTLDFYYSLIGTLQMMNEHLVLDVRVVSCINGLDFSLFEKALELRQEYLQNKNIAL